MTRRAWLALVVVAVVLVVVLAHAGVLDEARAYGAGGPVPPPQGWVLVGRAPGGWEYLDCGRMLAVVVGDDGRAVGAAAVLPTQSDVAACEEASAGE
ncbi:MAG: hypothetical protein IMW98_08545 [Firmicutes bacterium]|nr:hypothetical protein [Bacillota bacterium]MBE3590854.1 hypothetical protein [Bacillota bacterium]